jgi:hypothetical protein
MPAMRRCRTAWAAVAALIASSAAQSALAATCAERPVQARGDPSRFEVVAKAKARGNWRARVRAMPTLGASYADWSKASDADYRCGQEDGRYRCMAIARPCRD